MLPAQPRRSLCLAERVSCYVRLNLGFHHHKLGGGRGRGLDVGMGSFFIVFVDLIMIGLIFKGHVVRQWTTKLSKTLAVTEDGAKISTKPNGDA